MFKDPELIKNNVVVSQEEGEAVNMKQSEHQFSDALKKVQLDVSSMKFDCKAYYPQDLVFELMMPKELLKKHEGLKNIHKLVDTSKDCGLLTRQELVSMLPPLLCDIKADHSVLDMCAAPGSKTAQVIEMIMNDHLNTLNQTNA